MAETGLIFCFAVSESYITHIRIIEDAAYPSSPPPPNANPNAKKPRIIIVAVRKSGRVRMHKARENANGSFSIGKTWMLDDLQSVQSYSTVNPTSLEEQQQKEWAGGTGFTVTIGKPYYWQANSPKEKQFFIASLVKIYTKYTGGKSPELIGFDARERDQLLGSSGRPSPVPPSPLQQAPQGYGRDRRQEQSREPPLLRTKLSRDAMQRPPAQMPPAGSAYSQPSRPQMRPQQAESPISGMDTKGSIPQQAPPSLRRPSGNNMSQDSFGRSEDGASLPPRSRGGMNGLPSTPGRFSDRSVTPTSQLTPDVSFSGGREPMNEIPPVPSPLSLPSERRRPPMPNLGDSRQRSQTSSDNISPEALSSSSTRREDLRPPTRSSERDDITTQPSPNSFQKAMLSRITTVASPDRQDNFEVPPASAVLPSPIASFNSPTAQPTEESAEDARPGLGPMIKSKKSRNDVAGQFLKAAKAANAFSSFKPRAGGAAERLREAQIKISEGPDGVTGVVPAPSLLRGMSSDSTASVPARVSTPIERPSSHKKNDSFPEAKNTVPEAGGPGSIRLSIPPAPTISLPETSAPEKAKVREVKRAKPPAETMAKELTAIGIDPSIIGTKGGELVSAWEEFGWVGEGMRTKNIDQMRDDVERELNKVQAGSWLSRLEEEDDRIEAIKSGLDKCIEECEELDGLFTLYLVELGVSNSLPVAFRNVWLTSQTLTEDVAYIEAQSQGLQVQTANQRLLQTELKSLLDTISISNDQLAGLREASLESPRGLEQIENSLVMLYKAMITIDPSLSAIVTRPSEDGSLVSGKAGGYGNSEIGSMRVLQEKKDVYKTEIAMFLRRLKPFLQVKFGMAVDETRQALEREKGSNLTRSAGKAKLEPRHHDLARDLLWRYSPLMLFSREVDRVEWQELMKMYEMVCRPLYQDEFRDACFAWKRTVRKPTGDEGDSLFTSQSEKQTEGIATTARKLTVKRSQTLAKSLRSPMGDNATKSSLDKADGRIQPHEVFAGILDETVPIMSMEQNFVVDFFHVTSLEQSDFADAVSATPPDARRGSELRRLRMMDPDRNLARLVVQSMEEIFSFYEQDLQVLVDWTLSTDPLYVLSMGFEFFHGIWG